MRRDVCYYRTDRRTSVCVRVRDDGVLRTTVARTGGNGERYHEYLDVFPGCGVDVADWERRVDEIMGRGFVQRRIS